MADAYHKVVAVISQPPEMRTDRDVTMLAPWFRKKSDLFRDLADAILHDLVRHCRFQRFKENDIIIRQGDKGDSFFTIVSGSVGIYVANDDEGEGPSNLDDESPRSTAGVNMALGAYIRSLGSGKSFGEVALIDSANRRGASVVAEEESDMIVVDRNLYTRSLKAAQKRDLEERIAFVESHPLFGKWKPKYKNYMAMGIARKVYRYGNHITQQGDVIKKVNFLLSGMALVTVDRKMKSETEHAHLKSQSAEVKSSRHRRREKKSARVDSMVEICLIGQRAVIGDIEAVCGLTKHTHTVTCIEPVHTYEMDMRSFHKLVMRRHPQTVEKLRAMVVFKIQNRWKRVRDKRVPIYRTILEKLLLHELRQEEGDILPGIKSSKPMTSSRRHAAYTSGPLTHYHKVKETRKGRDLISSRQSLLLPRLGDPQGSNTSVSSKLSTRKNLRDHAAEGASVEQGEQSLRQNVQNVDDVLSITMETGGQKGKKTDAIINRKSKRGSPTKIKWLLPEDERSEEHHRGTKHESDSESRSKWGSNTEPMSSMVDPPVEQTVSSGEEPHGFGNGTLPLLGQGKQDAIHQRNVFVTERPDVLKGKSAQSRDFTEHAESGSSVDEGRFAASNRNTINDDDHGDKRDPYSDHVSDDEYDNDVFEESDDHDSVAKGESETDQMTNEVPGSSVKKTRTLSSRMSSESAVVLDQEDLLQLAYETYVSVSSEIKKFLVKVIEDAKRYEGSHPAGLESRLRPINSKLPRFLDEQQDGITREGTLSGRSGGRTGYATRSAKQQQRQRSDISSTVNGRRRERSKSESDTETFTRSAENVTSTKLPSLQHHQSVPPKTFYQIAKEAQEGRQEAPSALDLIYRQFGAVKKGKPRRQYTEEEYKELKDMLRAQQKRYIRYQINL